MKHLLSLALLLFASVSSSCAATSGFTVLVDGRAVPGVEAKRTFAVQPEDERTDSLAWQEYAAWVRRALEREGFTPTSRDSAELTVVVSYGISAPEEFEYSYKEPVYGQTGETTTYATNSNPYQSYDASKTTTPTYGVTHYETRTGRGVRFHRNLALTAYGRDEGGEWTEPALWQTRMRSTGSSGDLRRVFPVMLAAAEGHIGRSTGKELQVSLDETDRSVAQIVAR